MGIDDAAEPFWEEEDDGPSPIQEKSPSHVNVPSLAPSLVNNTSTVLDDGPKKASSCVAEIPNNDKRHWHSGEIIASFLTIDAAKRQKQSCTKVFRAKFAAGCYIKFAKTLSSEGRWDDKVDFLKSRDLRFKFPKTRKNAGESAAYRKIVEVKREIINVILPIYLRLAPQGVSASGI